MDLTQIIYINENRFVCQLVEKLCKQNEIACYSLDQIEDFTYLVNDLRPQLVLVALETFDSNEQLLTEYIQKSEHQCKLKTMREITPNTFIEELQKLI